MEITVNGVSLFYVREGSGPPVLLIHGNGDDHSAFAPLIEELCRDYTVYALDSRGHGRSQTVAALRYEDMAEDVLCLIRALGLEKPVLYGFSDGGIIGLLAASREPQLLSRLIVCGANTRPWGLKWGFLLSTLGGYVRRRDPLDKLMLTQPWLTRQELGRIATPTLVLAGERDLIRTRHTRRLAAAIPGAQLRILPGETHSSYINRRPEGL